MTPLHMDLLLHAHTGSPWPRPDAPAAIRYIADLIEWGLIVETDGAHGVMHRSTERGDVWIEHVLSTPLPEKYWSVPDRPDDGGGP